MAEEKIDTSVETAENSSAETEKDRAARMQQLGWHVFDLSYVLFVVDLPLGAVMISAGINSAVWWITQAAIWVLVVLLARCAGKIEAIAAETGFTASRSMRSRLVGGIPALAIVLGYAVYQFWRFTLS